MSVGQMQKETKPPRVGGAGGMAKLLAMTGHAINLRVRAALIWGVALGALGAVFVAIYPSLASASGMEPANKQHAPGDEGPHGLRGGIL